MFLFTCQTASALDSERGEAPRHFVDAFSSARIYPNVDTALLGVSVGTLHRPFDKCIHFAAEGFARFGQKDVGPEDFTMLTAGGALGILWGAGDQDHWFGAGVMADLGWARVGERDDFVSSAYLRALLYWRLRKEFGVGVDVRTGHVVAPVTVDGVGIKGAMVGLGVGFNWGKQQYDNQALAPEPY